ncbi:hypothetical protein EI555_020468, partial [Monodon monoceros]
TVETLEDIAVVEEPEPIQQELAFKEADKESSAGACLLLSCRNNIAELEHNKPLYSFEDNADYVYDVMWSPVHPALFACVDGMGRLDLWNLNNDTEVPTASVAIEGASALNRVRWAQGGKEVAVGDSEGRIWIYDVGEGFPAFLITYAAESQVERLHGNLAHLEFEVKSNAGARLTRGKGFKQELAVPHNDEWTRFARTLVEIRANRADSEEEGAVEDQTMCLNNVRMLEPRLETEKSFITEERYPGKQQQQQQRSKLHSNVKAVMPLKGQTENKFKSGQPSPEKGSLKHADSGTNYLQKAGYREMGYALFHHSHMQLRTEAESPVVCWWQHQPRHFMPMDGRLIGKRRKAGSKTLEVGLGVLIKLKIPKSLHQIAMEALPSKTFIEHAAKAWISSRQPRKAKTASAAESKQEILSVRSQGQPANGPTLTLEAAMLCTGCGRLRDALTGSLALRARAAHFQSRRRRERRYSLAACAPGLPPHALPPARVMRAPPAHWLGPARAAGARVIPIASALLPGRARVWGRWTGPAHVTPAPLSSSGDFCVNKERLASAQKTEPRDARPQYKEGHMEKLAKELAIGRAKEAASVGFRSSHTVIVTQLLLKILIAKLRHPARALPATKMPKRKVSSTEGAAKEERKWKSAKLSAKPVPAKAPKRQQERQIFRQKNKNDILNCSKATDVILLVLIKQENWI